MPKLVKNKVARRMVVASLIAICIGVGIGPYFLQMAGLPIEALGAVGGVAFSVEGYLMFRAKYKPEPEPEPEPELSRRDRVHAFASNKFNSLMGLLRPAPIQEQPVQEPQVQELSAQEVAELLTWAAVPMAFPFIGGAGVNAALIAALNSYTSTAQTLGLAAGVIGALLILWIALRFGATLMSKLKSSTLFIINKVNGALLLAIGLYLFANNFTAMVVRAAVLTLRQMGVLPA
jgi:small neutral amino acid transporter SnatA (MarC family)